MIFPWNLNRRRKKLQQSPLSSAWLDWLSANLWHWHVLDETARARLSGLIQIFVAEKNFEGCDGLVVTAEMKVTIAAAAGLLLLGFSDTYCFDSVRTLLVYPKPTRQRNFRRADGVIDDSQWLSGMAQQGGPIILSWADVRRDCRNPDALNNVVIHEFAHNIDGLDGAMEGQPPLPTVQLQSQWRQLAEEEREQLRLAANAGLPTVIDPYGMNSPAEFFAVASESFFCDGLSLQEHHTALYELLATLYRIETHRWFAQRD